MIKFQPVLFCSILFLTFITAIHCKSPHLKIEKQSSFKGTPQVVEENLTSHSDTLNGLNFHQFITKLKTLPLPYTDSSSIDQTTHQAFLSKENIKLLKLEPILMVKNNPDEKIWLIGKVKLSTDFYSIIIGQSPNQHELFTRLVNFSKDGKIIDNEILAYDEIAESCSHTASVVNKNKITSFLSNDCSNSVTDTVEYSILKTGKIVKNKTTS